MAGAALQFTQFTDDRIIFANKGAANNWFASIRIPVASVDTPGVLDGQMDSLTLSYTEPTEASYTVPMIAADGSQSSIVVAGNAEVQLLKAQVTAMNALLQSMLTQMRTVGLMEAA